jgi:hypothetical protein
VTTPCRVLPLDIPPVTPASIAAAKAAADVERQAVFLATGERFDATGRRQARAVLAQVEQ